IIKKIKTLNSCFHPPGYLGKSQSKEPETPFPPLGPVAVDPKDCVTITIHAKPGSKQKAVTTEAVSVAIEEANAELCQYLSKVLELRKSDIRVVNLVKKVLKLLASTAAEVILEKLNSKLIKRL
uniref:Uncharacterized protein n=1 Tax=Canis lupus familiaris TaxID=9615 RepID=A0A8C0TN83_CANLF